MGTISGIIAEFNPFHSGHAYLISCAKQQSDGVVCVMSGSFVQRGEPALLSKSVRAAAALACGADLIFELPAPYSLARARDFATGSISALASLGIIDSVFFGSECGDISQIRAAAEIEKHPDFPLYLKSSLEGGKTFAKAREEAAYQINQKAAELLGSPNDILATEYLMAAENLGFSPEFVAVSRVGVAHDSESTSSEFTSASKIRSLFPNPAALEFTPKPAASLYLTAINEGAYLDRERFELAAAAIIRMKEQSCFKNLPDISEGLENALIQAAKKGSNFSQICEIAKSKRYSLARIRRLLCCAALGIKAEHVSNKLPYLRVLGMSEKGETLIREIARKTDLPIIVRAADLANLQGIALDISKTETAACDLQALCMKNALPCGSDYTNGVIKQNKNN